MAARSDAAGDEPGSANAAFERARRVWASSWDWLVVAALGVWMFIVRMRPFSKYHSEDATYFIGTDPYYHARQVTYTIEHFPSTLGFDPLTQYPLGTTSGQFGTLFDQIAAALTILLKGTSPAEAEVLSVLVAYPALLGALTIIPVYLLARELVGRGPALFGALVLALLPGQLLVRSLAAYTDHHALEAVLSTLAVWAVVRAVRSWERSGYTVDDLVSRPRDLWHPKNRRALLVSIGAAVAFWAYLSAWPPGVLFVGIVGAWLVIDVVLEQVRGRDASPVVLTGVAVFLPLSILMTLHDHDAGCSALKFTWMQPLAAILVALAASGLAATGHVWRSRALPRFGYIGAALGLGALGVGLIALLAPSCITHSFSGLGWVTGVGVQRTRLTIAEAQSMELSEMFDQFGLLFYTAAAGLVVMGVHALRGSDRAGTLLTVWAVLATTATFTQNRFLYYLAIVVALLNAVLLAHLLAWADELSTRFSTAQPKAGKLRRTTDAPRPTGLTTPRVIAVAVMVIALMPVNVLGAEAGCGGANAYQLADCFGPGDERLWRGSLVWLRDNTPEPPLSLTDEVQRPGPGERFVYPEGAYGVLSWWDYGHQIEFDAKRYPVANPFQQQAPLASRIFTAPSERDAMALLDDYLGPEGRVRYLMIDDQIVSTKFGAIAIWAERDHILQEGGERTFEVPGTGDLVALPVIGPRVERMFLISLYYNDGNGMQQWRLVHEAGIYSAIGNRGRIDERGFTLVRYNDLMTRNTADVTLQNFGSLDFRSGRGMVPIDEARAWYDVRVASSLKTYERVAGAELTGTVEPGTTVSASVELEVTRTGRTFTYEAEAQADEQGVFAMRVPYSTIDPVSVDNGGTASEVVSRGPYRLRAGDSSASVSVPDAAVLDGSTIVVEFA